MLKWWRRRTSESIAVTPKEVLLGIHSNDSSLQYNELSLPLTYLRTQTLSTIKKERSRVRKEKPARTVEQLCKLTLQELQKSANSLYINACNWDKWHPPKGDKVHPRSLQSFKETWISSGIAKLSKAKSLPVILRAPGH